MIGSLTYAARQLPSNLNTEEELNAFARTMVHHIVKHAHPDGEPIKDEHGNRYWPFSGYLDEPTLRLLLLFDADGDEDLDQFHDECEPETGI